MFIKKKFLFIKENVLFKKENFLFIKKNCLFIKVIFLFIKEKLLSFIQKYFLCLISDVKDISICISPLSAYIEDIYIFKLIDTLLVLSPTKLVIWPKRKKQPTYLASGLVSVPLAIGWSSSVLAKPITIHNFTIQPLSVALSVHSSIKLYIALDRSPLQFGKFERKRLLTTPYR